MKELFDLDDRGIHLNHGSFGAVPREITAAQRRIQDNIESDPTAFFFHQSMGAMADARRVASQFLGADPVVFVPNTSAGIDVALRTIVEPGNKVAITNHTYPGVRFATRELCRALKADLVEVKADLTCSNLVSELVAAAPDVIVVDSITSATARLIDVSALVKACPSAEVIVDGAHAPGLIETPVAIDGIAAWTGNLHKWAFSPRPCGTLWIAEEYRSRVIPHIANYLAGQEFPESFDWPGTFDPSPYMCISDGLDFLREHPNTSDISKALDAFSLASGFEAVPPSDGVPMGLVKLPMAVADLAAARALAKAILTEAHVSISITLFDDEAFVRISQAPYNTLDDYEQAGKLIGQHLQ